MTATLEAFTANTKMLPDVSSLEDVTAIRLEVVNASAANLSKLDVNILGCRKGKDFADLKVTSR